MRRVVVTGIGAITPIGNSVEAFREGLKAGRSGAGPITYFDPAAFRTKFACEVKGFDPEASIDKKEAKRMDLFCQFGMASAAEAMKHSGLDLEKLNLDMAGVIWGSGIGGLVSLEKEIESFAMGNGTPRYSPFLIPRMISDIVAGHISILYGFRGVNYATISACASSNHALINAMDYIRMGRADVIIAGGSEAAVTHAGLGGFNAMKALSERNDDPATASRPFDRDRDGFVLGEGAGCLILEELEHARARGANILAEVVGGAMTADAYHMTAPHPEGLGARNVMLATLKDAGMNKEEIDYVNVHGTSTPLGDIAETKAITQVFGDHAYKLDISSTKSMTGHLLGAAGAVEAIACILAMQDNFIPPTINHFTDDPEIDPRLRLTFNQPIERKISAALSNTFGFGGHNASVLFKQFTD
ncbi:MAG: beta-ketoacyl-ACP synthase II [Saprospiraceae bacterium]|nr:beta-ketoacyl-ACP synthase II [Saprospiraceae bacterium]